MTDEGVERSSHGAIALDPPACTSCNLCVTSCPAWCIELTARTETVSGEGRPRKVKVLERFEIDFGVCMFCGICVEVCPFDALRWVPDPVAPSVQRERLVEDAQGLADRWPGPPADAGREPQR